MTEFGFSVMVHCIAIESAEVYSRTNTSCSSFGRRFDPCRLNLRSEEGPLWLMTYTFRVESTLLPRPRQNTKSDEKAKQGMRHATLHPVLAQKPLKGSPIWVGGMTFRVCR